MDIIHSTQVASFHPELHLAFHPPFGADCICDTADVHAHLPELYLAFHPPFGADCISDTADVHAHLPEQSYDLDSPTPQ